MYVFCPKCKNKLIKKNEYLSVCNRCGFHLYENPRPTNGLIAENEKGEILLVKRKADPKKGFWDIPGGFVDLNESMEESLVREIKEELGVNPTYLQYLLSVPDRYLYKGLNYHTLCFVFSGKVDIQNLKISDDITGYKFFPKVKIPFAEIAFAGVKKGIRYYLSSFSLNQSERSP